MSNTPVLSERMQSLIDMASCKLSVSEHLRVKNELIQEIAKLEARAYPLATGSEVLDNAIANLQEHVDAAPAFRAHSNSETLLAAQRTILASVRQQTALLEVHRHFHSTVACPGLPECFVCQLEESYER